MAEDIAGICREYVDEQVAETEGQNIDDAVAELTVGAMQRLRLRGWGDDASTYGVDVEEVVRNRLEDHRA